MIYFVFSIFIIFLIALIVGGILHRKNQDDALRDCILYSKAKQKMQSSERGSKEFLDAWKQLETIKNRHGGMPPMIP